MESSMLVVSVSSWVTGSGMENLLMTWLNVTPTGTANGRTCPSCVLKLENPTASTTWVRKTRQSQTFIGHNRHIFFFLTVAKLFADFSTLCWPLQSVTLKRSASLVDQHPGQAVFTIYWRTKDPWAFTLAGNNLTGFTNLEMTLDTSKLAELVWNIR